MELEIVNVVKVMAKLWMFCRVSSVVFVMELVNVKLVMELANNSNARMFTKFLDFNQFFFVHIQSPV